MTIEHIPTVRNISITRDQLTGTKSINEYEVLNKLGNGTHGKVYLVKSKMNGSKYAIKEISKVTKINILNKNPDLQINKILNEINIMKIILNHPKILKLYKILNDFKSNKIYLVLEYCVHGELKFNRGLTDRYELGFIKSMIRDVALGLEYIHSLGIIHRDIKPSNLLLNHDNLVKISDFGISHLISSNVINENITNGFGTPAFMSPELCDCHEQKELNDLLNSKVDIWAFGVTIYCLVFGEVPFLGKNEYDLFNKIINDKVDFSINRLIFKDEEVSENEKYLLIDLLQKMLTKVPIKRIDLDAIKKHEFVINDLSDSELLTFQRFNEQYLIKNASADSLNTNEKLKKVNSFQQKFKSLFKRRSSSASSSNPPSFPPVSGHIFGDGKASNEVIPESGSEDEDEDDNDSVPIPTHLSNKLSELSESHSFLTKTPQKKPLNNTIGNSDLEIREKSSFTILADDALPPSSLRKVTTQSSSGGTSSSTQKLPNSNNSRYLSSFLDKKKIKNDQFNGFQIYQSYGDSDDDDSDSMVSFEDYYKYGDEEDHRFGDGGEDLLDVRGVTHNNNTEVMSPKLEHTTVVSQVKTVNEYFDSI